MKINKNYPLSLAVDSFLRAINGTRQPSEWFFSEEPVQSARAANYRVLEQEDLYEIKFLLPGFSRKEISVSLEGSNLTVLMICRSRRSLMKFKRRGPTLGTWQLSHPPARASLSGCLSYLPKTNWSKGRYW